jgi:hypothetical protein
MSKLEEQKKVASKAASESDLESFVTPTTSASSTEALSELTTKLAIDTSTPKALEKRDVRSAKRRRQNMDAVAEDVPMPTDLDTDGSSDNPDDTVVAAKRTLPAAFDTHIYTKHVYTPKVARLQNINGERVFFTVDKASFPANTKVPFLAAKRLTGKKARLESLATEINNCFTNGTLPNAFRLNSKPMFGIEDAKFEGKWFLNLTHCSIDNMRLTTRYCAKEVKKINKDIDQNILTIRNELKSETLTQGVERELAEFYQYKLASFNRIKDERRTKEETGTTEGAEKATTSRKPATNNRKGRRPNNRGSAPTTGNANAQPRGQRQNNRRDNIRRGPGMSNTDETLFKKFMKFMDKN